MLRHHRPPEPDGYAARVAAAQAAIEVAVKAGSCLEDKHFPDLWSDCKPHFYRAQHKKCGYCDGKLSDTGCMDHYRPKRAVQVLPDDEALWGREIDHGANVEGRRPVWISPRGYYWQTYAWSNFVLACERCNTGWKKNLFPVAEADRPIPPDPSATETPLLLNPFEGKDPTAHLTYDRLGQIAPRKDSVLGRETIRTCGLDRESLRDRREDGARRAHYLVQQLARTSGIERERVKADLRQLGRVAGEFAGMVRSIFEDKTGCRWQDMFGEVS